MPAGHLSEDLYRQLVDLAPQAILLVGRDGNIAFANPQALAWFGYTAEDLIGQPMALLLPERYREGHDRHVRAFFDHPVFRPMGTGVNLTALRRDGGEFPVDISLSPIETPNGLQVMASVVDLSRQTRTEQALLSSQQLFKDVVGAIGVAIVMVDVHHRIRLVNPAAEKVFGYGSSELLDQPLDVLVPAAFRRDHAAHAGSYFTDPRGRAMGTGRDFSAQRKDGTVFTAEIALTRLATADGTMVLAAIWDQTERKVAEAAIRGSEAKVQASQRLLQTVFETIPFSIRVTARDGSYMMVNKAWARFYNTTPEEAQGRNLLDYPPRPEAERQRIYEEDQDVLSGHAAQRVDNVEYTDHQGKQNYVRSIKAPLPDEAGRAIGVVGVYVNLTAEREAQRNADLAHARLYDAIESLPAAFFLFDAGEGLVLWNSRVREFFPELYPLLRPGLPYPELLRQVSPTVLRAKDRPDAWAQERLAQFRTAAGPYEQQQADGRWLQGFDRRTSDGGTVSLQFDITQLKSREQELRQAQKMEALGQLTGGVAHDFNNVLQVIVGCLELAQREAEPGQPILQMLKTAEEAGQRAAELTQQLLTFSRRRVLHLQPLDLATAVRGIARLIERLLPPTIALLVREGPAVEPVTADRGMIEQVLMNLSVNARDAMAEGGRIDIELSTVTLDAPFCRSHAWAKPGRYSMFRVADTGPGIRPEDLERIFEPFFTTKGPGKGTGLGLATVYGIVQQHKGLIQVESEVGAGTRFSVYLPVSVAAPVAASAPAPEAVRGGTETVLLAEDEQTVRRLSAAALESAGYRVLAAADGEEALALLDAHRGQVALAVLDMTMPKLGGTAASARMQEREPRLRFVFSSGWYSPDEERFLAAGSFTRLDKPYTREQLLRAVRQALDATP